MAKVKRWLPGCKNLKISKTISLDTQNDGFSLRTFDFQTKNGFLSCGTMHLAKKEKDGSVAVKHP